MINKHITILLFISLLPSFLPGMEENAFIISFEPFISKDIDANYHHLANSIPRMLYYELQNASRHVYSEEEIISLKYIHLESLRDEHLLILSDLIEKYDMYLFSNNYNKAEYISLGEEIEKEKELLDKLDDSIITDEEPDVLIKFNIDNEGINIFDSEKYEISDLIIKGSIDKLDEWIYLQIWTRNNILNREELMYESIGSPDSVSDLIPEIISKLKTVVLGRPWASLIFDLAPEDSNILVKKGNEQISPQSFYYLYPGVYDIEITKPGYISDYIKIDLEALETRIIPVSLEVENCVTISVQSFPAGADLYSGATWIGKTPLLMENPIVPALLTFKLEGYNDNKVVFKDENKRDIQIFMQSSIIDNDKIISRKRNRFYQSFSYFLLSIPISLVSYGLSSDYGYAYNREFDISPNSSEADRLMQLSTSWYNVYLGGVFLNLTLFVNTIFDLLEYIKSNDHF